MSATPVYCVNHPKTETLLRCNKCDKPVCIKCVERTPVGYRCKECLNIQQAGYYTATSADYTMAAMVGIVVSIVGGAIAAAISGLWLFEIFYAPFAGGIIAEVIRRAIGKRRGRYVWLVVCGAVIVGGFLGAGILSIPGVLAATLRSQLGASALLLWLLSVPIMALAHLLSIGFLIYLALAVGTVYARLK